MSRTGTTTTTKTKGLQRSGSILLSPPKRARLAQEAPVNQPLRPPSEQEIWKWTLTSAAVAKCYIRDAMGMSENKVEGCDFFWLGRVPCRKVEICGIVVGIQVQEKKVVYTVDDGTDVIDCSHTPEKPSRSNNLDKNVPFLLPRPPRPICRIGNVVKAKGRIQRKYETRMMITDEISKSCFDAQLTHWKAVRGLHRTHYSSSEPFVIPAAITSPETPKKAHNQSTGAQTPPVMPVPSQQSIAQTPSTVVSSPVAIDSSPVKPKWVPQSPPKLRHPSRLRSQNLTDAAFRLYVKHFVDNAPEDDVKDDSDSDEDLEELYQTSRPYSSRILGTPTKSRIHGADEHTPRPKSRKTLKEPSLASQDNSSRGFTLSYLRRVPELSLMATRVVKQHAKLLDKKTRESSSQSTSESTSKQPAKRIRLDRASLAKKKKRLFQWAICELLRDGSIVLWEGRKRPCPDYETYGNANVSMLWKYSSSTVTDSSLFSNAGNSTLNDENDEMELSDPEPDEEAYVSTKPEFLVPAIMEALKALAVAPPKQIVRRNELAGGSTKEDVLAYLRRDDRWAFIGEWNVAEALECMGRADFAWCAGERWMLM